MKYLLIALTSLLWLFVSNDSPEKAVEKTEVASPTTNRTWIPQEDDVLWLARCIYSETKRPEEMELVAWVVRNRVETGYKKGWTYQRTILMYKQFSAFNPGYKWRAIYLSLDRNTRRYAGWKTALKIAERVYHAASDERPFPIETRHFYSPRSMRPVARVPDWAKGETPISIPGVDPWRFRFYHALP